MTSNGGVNRRFISGLDSEVLAVHMCYSFLGMVLFWMTMHFVEVGFCFGAVWMAGIGNGVPVLGHLQGICNRLLVLAVQMLILVWGFARDLLETAPFLMDFREPL